MATQHSALQTYRVLQSVRPSVSNLLSAWFSTHQKHDCFAGIMVRCSRNSLNTRAGIYARRLRGKVFVSYHNKNNKDLDKLPERKNLCL